MQKVDPFDITRIENFLDIKVNEIQKLETSNKTARFYSVNNDYIVEIDNVTNECSEVMG